MFPGPNTSLLVASEQEEIKAYICALAKMNALRTEGSVFSHFLGRTNKLGHFRGGYCINGRGGKKKKERKTKPTSNNTKGSRMLWCYLQRARGQVRTKPGEGKRIRICQSRKLRTRKEGPIC